jgi:hypothetical protein
VRVRPAGEAGAAPIALERARIRASLTGERKLSRDEERDVGARLPVRISVDARFVLRNHGDQRAVETFAVPDWLEFGESGAPWGLKRLRVTVGGKAVESELRELEAPYPWTASLPGDLEGMDPQGARTFTVAFRARQRLEVRVRYEVVPTNSLGGSELCVSRLPGSLRERAWWLRAADRRGGWAFRDSYCRAFTFWLDGLADWHDVGPIDVELLGRLERPWPHLFAPLPAAAAVGRSRIRWRFSGSAVPAAAAVVWIEPTYQDRDDLWLPLFDTTEQARAWIEHARASGYDRSFFVILRDVYRARYDRRGVSRATRDLLRWRDDLDPGYLQGEPQGQDAAIMELLSTAARPR